MEFRPKPATRKAVGKHFSGDVWIDILAEADEHSRVRASYVRFAPGARNAWHNHVHGQILHVTEGVGRIQSRGGKVREIRAGDTIWTPPGEWHWHGADPEHHMTHLALFDASSDPETPDAQWGPQVTEDEYDPERRRP